MEQDKDLREVECRILPRLGSDVIPSPRVTVLGEDEAGFTLVRAKLRPGEDVCWRCGSIAEDPEHNLEVCPVCGDDFND